MGTGTFHCGLQDDLIIRGGYNVYPREVEEVLPMNHNLAVLRGF